ncbi:MAG: carbohydrate ABC transporter permease, partial [Clostridia bacterium]
MVASQQLRHKKDMRLNSFSAPMEALFHVLLAVFALACIIPFVFVLIISFSSEASIRQIGYSFLPVEWSLESYKYVMRLGDALWRSYFNSFYITILGTAMSVMMCILYSYPLFRRDFKYRGFFNFMSFFTMIFGGGLVPTFII